MLGRPKKTNRFAERDQKVTNPSQPAPPKDCAPHRYPAIVDAVTKKTIVPIDTQCLGWPNVYLVGVGPNGQAEYALIDQKGDKKIDAKIIYGFETNVDLWIIYGGRDDVPTAFGYDHGRKGKPDRYVVVGAGLQ